MNLKKLKIIKADERGVVYECDGIMYVLRKKGTVTADHIHDDLGEILYLIKGTIKLTVGEEVKKVSAPTKIEIPKKIYHKILALSDIEFLKTQLVE